MSFDLSIGIFVKWQYTVIYILQQLKKTLVVTDLFTPARWTYLLIAVNKESVGVITHSRTP